jgi:sterol desaturase/sphingolipid hydroxylase (fatty acid hydroxylase superfamily)
MTAFVVHLPWIDRLFGTAYLPAGRQLAGTFLPDQARTRSDPGS